MADTITLSSPQTFVAPPTISSYSPGSICITVAPVPHITVGIYDNAGNLKVFEYPNVSVPAFDTPAKVLTLISSLNTANLSIQTLWQRTFTRLVADFPTSFNNSGIVG